MPLNKRQAKRLNKLFDDFDGKLTSNQRATFAELDQDNALGDITELLACDVLMKFNATAAVAKSWWYILDAHR
jgi:Fic family protein